MFIFFEAIQNLRVPLCLLCEPLCNKFITQRYIEKTQRYAEEKLQQLFAKNIYRNNPCITVQ